LAHAYGVNRSVGLLIGAGTLPWGRSLVVFLLFRFYGPEKPIFDKTWILDDVEKLK